MRKLDRLPLPTDCVPRFVTGKEEESLILWLEKHTGRDFSDTCGMYMASHVAVYDNCNRMIGGYLGTVIVLNNGDNFYVFSWNKNGVKLEQQYQLIEATNEVGQPFGNG